MPYIKQKDRAYPNEIIRRMQELGTKADGDLNYILFCYAKYHIPQSYNSLKNYLGELNEAAEEIRRRLLVPYENERMEENGDA